MTKYLVKIKEVMEHTFEVEEVNTYMAKEKAIELLKNKQRGRIPSISSDIELKEI